MSISKKVMYATYCYQMHVDDTTLFSLTTRMLWPTFVLGIEILQHRSTCQTQLDCFEGGKR